jgi:uncharacterized membrane protein
MNYPIKSFIISSITLIILDVIFLYINGNTFKNIILNIQGTPLELKIWSAVICYIIITTGLWYFIISKHRSPFDAFLLGIFVNGVYETTTYSVLKKWSPILMIIDTLWGGILFSVTTIITYKLLSQ